MTRKIRETDNYIFFEEQLTKHTAIMERSSGEISNWNTGAEAEEEKRKLIVVEKEEFDNYCKQIIQSIQ